MEGSSGAPLFPSGHHHQPASSSSSGVIIHHKPPTASSGIIHHQPATASSAANPAGQGGAPAKNQPPPQQQQPAQRVMTREHDQYMPIANVIRIMRRILPAHAKISDEAKETVQECVSEYISFITSEANQRCRQEQRKTVTADDLLWAMEKLGFENYVRPLSLYLHRYRNGEGSSGGHYVPRVQPPQVLAPPELAPAMPPLPPPSYYYGSGYNYPVAPHQMGPSGAGSSSSGGGALAYYDPYAHLRNDRF